MNIVAEKEAIMKQFQSVHDIDLIKAVKSLLDFGIQKQINDDIALNASIERGLNDIQKGLVRPHTEVISDIRNRYEL